MPIRPVSFLAQAAAQRQQTRENEKQREFQKEQALRDFGMNIGQSIVASLGNFGAQAGADAIRFNREEPYKMLEAGVNPMPEVSAAPAKAVGTGAADMLSKAAMARSPMQAPPTPAAEAPVPAPKTPAYPMRQAAPVAKPAQPAGPPQAQAPAFDPYKAMRDPSSVLPRQAAPAPSAPTPAPAPAPVAADVPGPQRPSSSAPMREEVVSRSVSTRGDAPEAQAVKLRALQEMEKITQRWLSGEPLRFVKKDGTPAEPREAAFAEAYQMKQDLNRLDMLSKAGLVEAEEAKALAYQIKMQAEGSAATQKANSDERLKMAQATKARAEAADKLKQVLNTKGRLTSDPPNELVVTERPGEWATSETVPNAPPPARGGGTGGARKQSAMFPDATEVWAQGYSETKNDRGQNLQEAVVLPEEYLALADPKLGKFRYITRADAPAIKAALDAKDWQTAQALFKEANAKYAKGYAAQTEAVTPPTVLANAADAAEKAKRAEEARALAAKTKAALDATRTREDAVKEADAARNLARNAPKAAELFPGLDDEDAAEAFAALKSGGRRPAGMRGPEWQAASDQWNKWLEARSVYLNRIDEARGKFKGAGGTDEDFDSLVPPPGPSQQSPGQFPPPGQSSPGDESKVDELFQMIESQPWSAERKRRVFLTRAREAGLA